MAVLTRFVQETTKFRTVELVHEIFKTVEALNPSKNAVNYWKAVNRTLLDFDKRISSVWREEKLASNEAILISKEEALTFLAAERARIMRLSQDEAISEVLMWSKLDNKVHAVQSVVENRILDQQ